MTRIEHATVLLSKIQLATITKRDAQLHKSEIAKQRTLIMLVQQHPKKINIRALKAAPGDELNYSVILEALTFAGYTERHGRTETQRYTYSITEKGIEHVNMIIK